MSTIFDNDTKQIAPWSRRPVMRQDPFSSPLGSLFGGSLLDSLFPSFIDSVPRYFDNLPKRHVTDTGDVEYEFNVAGYQPDEVKAEIDTTSYRLMINAKHDEEGKKREYSTSVGLDSEADLEKVQTILKDGLLTVRIPMKEKDENSIISLAIEKSD